MWLDNGVGAYAWITNPSGNPGTVFEEAMKWTLSNNANYYWNVSCLDPYNVTTSATWWLKVDTTPPLMENNSVSPASPMTYTGTSWVPQFSIDIVDILNAVDSVKFNLNNSYNYTTIKGPLNNYSRDYFNPFTPGTYYYNWTANDSVGNANTSATYTLVVVPATPTLALAFNGTEGNMTVNVGSMLTLTTTELTGDAAPILSMYKNGVLINTGPSTLSNNTIFSVVGLYNITATYATTQNYTYYGKSYFITVADVTPPAITIDLPLNGTNQTVNTSVNVAWTAVDNAAATMPCSVQQTYWTAENVIDGWVKMNTTTTQNNTYTDYNQSGVSNNTRVTYFVNCSDTANSANSSVMSIVTDSKLPDVTTPNGTFSVPVNTVTRWTQSFPNATTTGYNVNESMEIYNWTRTTPSGPPVYTAVGTIVEGTNGSFIRATGAGDSVHAMNTVAQTANFSKSGNFGIVNITNATLPGTQMLGMRFRMVDSNPAYDRSIYVTIMKNNDTDTGGLQGTPIVRYRANAGTNHVWASNYSTWIDTGFLIPVSSGWHVVYIISDNASKGTYNISFDGAQNGIYTELAGTFSTIGVSASGGDSNFNRFTADVGSLNASTNVVTSVLQNGIAMNFTPSLVSIHANTTDSLPTGISLYIKKASGIYNISLNFNGTTYNSPTFISQDIYTWNVSQQIPYILTPGNYSYNWTVFDNSHNSNVTATMPFVVTRADPQVNTTINPSAFSYYNGEEVNFTCTDMTTDVTNVSLYINTTLNVSGISPLTAFYNFTSGYYNISCKYPGSQNYTYGSDDLIVNVTGAQKIYLNETYRNTSLQTFTIEYNGSWYNSTFGGNYVEIPVGHNHPYLINFTALSTCHRPAGDDCNYSFINKTFTNINVTNDYTGRVNQTWVNITFMLYGGTHPISSTLFTMTDTTYGWTISHVNGSFSFPPTPLRALNYSVSSGLYATILWNRTFTEVDTSTYIIYIPPTVNISLWDEGTLQPFVVSAVNGSLGLSMDILCIDGSVPTTKLVNNSFLFNSPCAFTGIRFTPHYDYYVCGQASTQYYRNILWTPTENDTMRKIWLISPANYSCVFTSFQIYDLMQTYENPAIYITRNINGTQVIHSDYVDIEGKMNTYLLQNQQYDVTVKSDNNPDKVLGNYFSDATGSKLLRLWDVSLEPNMEMFTTDLQSYLYIVNTSTDIDVAWGYNDTTNRTLEWANLVMRLDNASGDVIYNSTFTAKQMDLLYPLPENQTNQTIYASVRYKVYGDHSIYDITKALSSFWSVLGNFANLKNNMSFSSPDTLNWIMYALLFCGALAFSIGTSWYGSLGLAGVIAITQYIMHWWSWPCVAVGASGACVGPTIGTSVVVVIILIGIMQLIINSFKNRTGGD